MTDLENFLSRSLPPLTDEMKKTLINYLGSGIATQEKQRMKKGREFMSIVQRSTTKELYDFCNEESQISTIKGLPLTIPRFRCDENKTYQDNLVALKIYNKKSLENAIVAQMQELSSGQVSMAIVKKSGAAALLMDAGRVSNGGSFGSNELRAFQHTLEYRSLVWGLEKLGFGSIKKLDALKALFENLEGNISDCVPDFWLKSIEEEEYKKYHNSWILKAIHHIATKYSDVDVDALDDELYNGLVASLWALTCLFPKRMVVPSMLTAYAPNLIKLLIHSTDDNIYFINSKKIYLPDGSIKPNIIDGAATIQAVAKMLDDEAEISMSDSIDLSVFNSDIFNQISVRVARNHEYFSEFAWDLYGQALEYFSNALTPWLDFKNIDQVFVSLTGDMTEYVDAADSVANVLKELSSLSTQISASESNSLPPETENISFTAPFEPEELSSTSHRNAEKVKDIRLSAIELIQSGKTDEVVEALSRERQYIDEMRSTIIEGVSFLNEAYKQLVNAKSDLLSVSSKPAEVCEINRESTMTHYTDEDYRLLEELTSNLDSELQSSREELSMVKAQLMSKQQELESVKNKRFESNEHSGVHPVMRKIMLGRYEISDIFELIKVKYPYVRFSDNFDQLVVDCQYKQKARLLRGMLLLCDDYYNAIMAGTPDSEAKEVIGSIFRANESDTVMGSPTLLSKRKHPVGGKLRLFTKHLTLGSAHDVQKTVQVYFDFEGSELILGYVGAHLPLD